MITLKNKPNKIQRAFIKGFGIDKYLSMWEKNREVREMALFGSQGYEGVENKLWFDGKGDKLEYFYKNVLPFQHITHRIDSGA